MEDGKMIYIFGESEDTYELITLDYHNSIIWDRNTSNFKNLLPLYYLPKGLFEIASKVRELEEQLVIENNGKPNLMIIDLSSTELLNCYFQWFSTSIINYLRLIAFVELSNKNNWTEIDLSDTKNKKEIKDFTRNYISGIIPEIVKWRNKISAHYTIVDPMNNDSINTMLNSVSGTVSYECPFYRANVFKIINSNTNGGDVEIPQWSLTQIYDDLSERFFPNDRIKSLEQIRNENYSQPDDNPIEELKEVYQSKTKLFATSNNSALNKYMSDSVAAIRAKNYPLLLETCIKGLKAKPDSLFFIKNLIILLTNDLKNPCEAKRLLEFGLKKHKRNIDLLINYSELLNSHFNERAKAIKYYEKAKKINYNYDRLKQLKKNLDRIIVTK